MISRARNRFIRFWFGRVNSHPLSVFRIGISLVLLKDALLHIPLTEMFYSEAGIVPRAARAGLVTSLGQWSILDLLPQTWMIALCFMIWCAVAICLLVGYQTRLMSIINFVLIVSVHARNPFVISGADDMLRLLSFWMIFVPLDHHYALSKWIVHKNPVDATRLTAYALPVRLMQVQVTIAYLAAGLAKLGGETWRSGESLYYVLQLESYLRPVGQWMAHNTPMWLLTLLAFGVLISELAFVFLVFSPVGQPLLSYLGITALGLMHLGIAITMSSALLDFLPIFGMSYILFFTPPVIGDADKTTTRTRHRSLASTALILLMCLIIWQNAALLTSGSSHLALPVPPLPSIISNPLQTVGLAQDWSLFAPNPLEYDPYMAMVGAFDDNSLVDLRTGQPFEEVIRPIPSGLTDYRWGNFNVQMFLRRPDALFNSWSAYYCHQYNTVINKATYPRLVVVQVRAIYHLSHLPNFPANPLQNNLLWLHAC